MEGKYKPVYRIDGEVLRNLPIRRKLMMITMTVAASALVMSGVGVMLLDSRTFKEGLRRDLSALSEIVAENCTAALAFDDERSATETLQALRARNNLTRVCLYRANGTLLARYSRPEFDLTCPVAPRADETVFSADELSIWRPIQLQERRLGTLLMAYNLDEIAERRMMYGTELLAILFGAGLVALLLSSRLSKWVARPVTRLAEAAETVSGTKDYGIRVEKFADDETGVLVDAFNEMLTGIQSRDIELREALRAREDALRDAQDARDFLQITLTSIGDAVISTDAEGRLLFVNPVALEMLGRTAADVTGQPIEDVFRIVNEQTGEVVESPVAQVLRDGSGTVIADHPMLIAEDGTEIPIDHSGAPIRDQYGALRGAVLVFRDVTAQRGAEATSRLLASIVESSEDGIISSDLSGTVTSWNRGAERIFGFTMEEMIGDSLLKIVPKEQHEELAGNLQKMAGGEAIFEHRTVRCAKDGRAVNVSLTMSPLLDAAGRIIGASKIVRDITEQVRAAEQLERAVAELRDSNFKLARSNEDLERFAFIASHDLQEPLRMITTYSQLLVRTANGGADGTRDFYVNFITEGTSRMRELLADLLSYTQIGSSSDEPMHSLDLNEVLDKVLQNLQASIDETGTVVSSDRLPRLSRTRRIYFSCSRT